MKVHHDLHRLPTFRNAVITIGSFDGVHLGHQKIIDQVNTLAREVDGESVLITFHPHPRQVVYPNDRTLKLINTVEEKILLLERYELDHVVVVPFTIEFSQQTADEYIQKFLVDKFHPRYIVIGYDHRFGVGRQGDINYLRWHGQRMGFEVIEIQRQEVEDIAVSSSKIRQALDKSDLQTATRLMGHPFLLTGTVVHGQKIGATIGFPTANLAVNQGNKLIPPNGIYAVRVHHQDQTYGGMLYIGDRPTLDEFNDHTIEVNIFDFHREIYGDKLHLELIEHIREDRKFQGLDGLSKQLVQDRISSKRALTAYASRQLPDQAPPVAVVILNYNGKKYLERFLPDLLASTYPNYNVHIADNGSSDDSLAFLADRYPDLPVIDLQGNHGFAKGYNLALQQVEADYYVLLNSDVEVKPGWIEPIIELMERDKTVAVCQPKIRSYQRRDEFEYAGASGGWIDWLGYPFCRGRIFSVTEKDDGQYDNTQEVFWATGAAFFVRARLFHQVGGFDPDYFAHAEEIDLCWRLKRAGYKIMVRPRSVVYHVGGGTLSYNTPRKTYLNFRNTLYTILKNEPVRKLLWLIPLRVVLDGLAATLFLAQGRVSHIGAIVRAHWTFFPQMGRVWRKRKAYDELVRKVSISPTTNDTAHYRGSIVWDFYARRRKHFRQLER